jgi:hypothetical protein
MPQKRIGRREFLKLTIAAVGAAGLSHFRILNIGGADVAMAQTDECSDTVTDICAVGASPDTCPEGADGGGTDSCAPLNGDPDFCEPFDLDEDDECEPPGTIPDDVCDSEDGDTCVEFGNDTCECGAADSPDACDPGGSGEPDACTPSGFVGGGDPDVCPDPPPGDGDICFTDNLGISEADYCVPPGAEDTCETNEPPQTPDICNPGTDPDSPNPVTVDSVGVESTSSILPSLGGVVAALGTAALWLRHRLRPEEPEGEDSA